MDSIITKPAISVIMPVYNAGLFLKEAIDSVLNQSFSDFEFFIIDDASTDDSVNIIKSYVDARIHFIQKEKNTGYTDSLNLAIGLAQGKYIARMDADDVCLRHRFGQQVQYLEKETDVLVLGTAYQVMGTNRVVRMPATFDEVKITAIMQVPVAHPTVMMRAEVFKKFGLQYDKKYEPAEDYDLWANVLEIGQIQNLPEPLLIYRQHPAQQSITRHDILIAAAVEIRLRQLNKLIDFNHKPYDILFAIQMLTMQPVVVSGNELKKMAILIADLVKSNLENKIYDQCLLRTYLRERWLFYVFKLNKPALKDFPLLFTMRRSTITKMGILFELKYLKRMFFSNKLLQHSYSN